MKIRALVLLGLIAVVGCKEKKEAGISAVAEAAVTNDGSVILVLEDDPMPEGAVVEEDFEMRMEDMKVVITLPDRELEGTMSSLQKRKGKSEGLAKNMIRRTLIKDTKTEESTMQGKAQPAKTKDGPLVGIPVIAEKGADGKWAASLESGEATPEIAKELLKVSKNMNDGMDARIYGTVPRKVGDEWEASGEDLMGIENSTGVFKVKLEAIEEFAGQRCAKLTGTMEVEGAAPTNEGIQNMKMKITGNFTVFRSIEHRVDLSNKLSGRMEMTGDMEPQPGMKMKIRMEGDTSMIGSSVVTAAK